MVIVRLSLSLSLSHTLASPSYLILKFIEVVVVVGWSERSMTIAVSYVSES